MKKISPPKTIKGTTTFTMVPRYRILKKEYRASKDGKIGSEYRVQERYITIFGNVKWKDYKTYWYGSINGHRYSEVHDFDKLKDARAYIKNLERPVGKDKIIN